MYKNQPQGAVRAKKQWQADLGLQNAIYWGLTDTSVVLVSSKTSWTKVTSFWLECTWFILS
jgi:hypothetical protein